MPQVSAQELCAMLDSIATGATDQLNRLIGRYAALRRVADLLFAAGLDIPLVDPTKLTKAILVDVDVYNQLQALCPGLLPPFNGTNLLQLQQSVNDSYLKLLTNLDTHPFAKLAQLQARVDSMVSDAAQEFQKRIGPGIQALNCARAICGATNSVGVYTQDIIQATQENYRNGIGLGGEHTNVLTTEQQAAVDKLAEARQTLLDLLDLSAQPNVEGTAGSTLSNDSPSSVSSQVLLRGPQGVQGVQGSEGSQGFQGARGNIGSQGNQGVPGAQGPQGAPSVVAGPQGSSGPQGIPGPIGNQGGLGPQGFQGVQGSLGGNFQLYAFSTSTADADPGLGFLTFDNADPTAVSQIYASTTSSQNFDVTAWLNAISSTGSPGFKGIFHLYSRLNTGDFAYYEVTLVTTATGYRKFNVSNIIAEGTFDNLDPIVLDFLPSGPQGLAGAQGTQGVAGSVGSQGAQGHQGFQGVAGSDGSQGSQGFQGVQGSAGAQGDAGPQGDVGAQGDAGPQGFQGVAGSAGVQGAQGFQGTQGTAGSAGAQGFQGFQGAAGSAGAQGAQGDAGVQGSQGDAGAQGFQGAQGTAGAQGAAGSQGAAGAQGASGAQGTQGFQGVQGDVGVQGPQGDAGAQGFQGFQGATGSGSQGSQGPQGYQGFQGDLGPQPALDMRTIWMFTN